MNRRTSAERRAPRRSLLLAGLVLAALAPASAGAQDVCAGISETPADLLTTVQVASGLSFPVLAVSPPGDTERLFIVELFGRIKILKNGAILAQSFLDVSTIVRSPASGGGGEEGLLGLAFHPDYATNGWFFVYYTNAASHNVVVRYTVSAGSPDLADDTTDEPVITLPHPGQGNHNGGMIAFSPLDGYLYIGTGDGGGGCDTTDSAQDGGSFNGKLLRLDVDSLPYTIPTGTGGNPFVGDASVDNEIWALGLRNPWRWSFDRETGDLYIGDVGQASWEEIDVQPGSSTGGENYAWPVYEGDDCPPPTCPLTPPCNSLSNPVLPVTQYANGPPGVMCAVVGGYVYRGCRMPDLRGTYYYSDNCTPFIKIFRWVGGVATGADDLTAELQPDIGIFTSVGAFGEDGRGELYILDLNGGELFKIVPQLVRLEVSGAGASPFVPGTGDWSWENLNATSSHPITSYRVWRQDGTGAGPFDCVFQSASPVWPGGDPQDPPADGLFTYLVTAVNAGGEETTPGTGSGGSARMLSAPACP